MLTQEIVKKQIRELCQKEESEKLLNRLAKDFQVLYQLVEDERAFDPYYQIEGQIIFIMQRKLLNVMVHLILEKYHIRFSGWGVAPPVFTASEKERVETICDFLQEYPDNLFYLSYFGFRYDVIKKDYLENEMPSYALVSVEFKELFGEEIQMMLEANDAEFYSTIYLFYHPTLYGFHRWIRESTTVSAAMMQLEESLFHRISRICSAVSVEHPVLEDGYLSVVMYDADYELENYDGAYCICEDGIFAAFAMEVLMELARLKYGYQGKETKGQVTKV